MGSHTKDGLPILSPEDITGAMAEGTDLRGDGMCALLMNENAECANFLSAIFKQTESMVGLDPGEMYVKGFSSCYLAMRRAERRYKQEIVPQ